MEGCENPTEICGNPSCLSIPVYSNFCSWIGGVACPACASLMEEIVPSPRVIWSSNGDDQVYDVDQENTSNTFKSFSNTKFDFVLIFVFLMSILLAITFCKSLRNRWKKQEKNLDDKNDLNSTVVINNDNINYNNNVNNCNETTALL